MKKLENVFKQLSSLYEFNRKLQTYKVQTVPKLKEQQSRAVHAKKRGGADAEKSSLRH